MAKYLIKLEKKKGNILNHYQHWPKRPNTTLAGLFLLPIFSILFYILKLYVSPKMVSILATIKTLLIYLGLEVSNKLQTYF